jgi:multidrug efflux pump
VLEAGPAYQTDPAVLDRLYVPGGANLGAVITGQGAAHQVPLSAFTTIERTTRPLAVHRLQQFPAATIGFDLAPGVSLDQAVAAINAAVAGLDLPSVITGRFEGTTEEFNVSLENQPWLILAAIIVIYIVLGVLYESFIHPFTILTTLPSAGIGALLALQLFDLQFTVVALIGIVLLMGIVKKNAIIMIDFALDAERQRGLSSFDAIREACHLRFRPIMMTTFAALLGALPLALGAGPGSELRVPLGITIIGGLLLSQLLTLYTTPVIYLAMDGLKNRLAKAMGGQTGFEPLPLEGEEGRAAATRPEREPVSP